MTEHEQRLEEVRHRAGGTLAWLLTEHPMEERLQELIEDFEWLLGEAGQASQEPRIGGCLRCGNRVFELELSALGQVSRCRRCGHEEID